jgi:ABC-2 type transport system ATP-binding protein
MEYPEAKRYRDYFLKPFRKRKKIRVLTDINLKITQGESIAFLGPNGAGKTTLLKLIAGFIFPTSGEVMVNGYNTKTDNIAARKSVGFAVNEERSFYWRLTGFQNLEFFGNLENLFGRELKAKIEEVAGLLGMTGVLHKPVSTYSTGMKRRLSMARALLIDPDILVLDEPIKALDPVGVEEYIRLILDKIHSRDERCLLIVTHRLEVVDQLCTRACILKDQRIVNMKTMDEIKQHYSSIAEYYTQGVC